MLTKPHKHRLFRRVAGETVLGIFSRKKVHQREMLGTLNSS